MNSLPHARLAVAVVTMLAVAAFASDPPAGSKSAWEGVYTAEQAARGAQTLAEQCVMCHAENLRGGPGAPGVVGAEFMFNWDGKTAGELFDYLRASMPPGQIGVLSDAQYADVLAAILQGNGFPAAGETALPAEREALDKVLITEEP